MFLQCSNHIAIYLGSESRVNNVIIVKAVSVAMLPPIPSLMVFFSQISIYASMLQVSCSSTLQELQPLTIGGLSPVTGSHYGLRLPDSPSTHGFVKLAANLVSQPDTSRAKMQSQSSQ